MDPSTLTEPPALPSETLDDGSLPATVDWFGLDGQLCSLGNSSNPVTFIVDFDESSRLALFLLRVDVGLRAQDPKVSNVKIHLFLRIRPDHVRSLTLDDQPQPSTGHKPLCLRFETTSPMDLVAPEPKLRAKNKAQIAVLHTIMRLAQQTAFNVRLEDQEAPKRRLQWLCRAVSNNELQPKDMAEDLRSYYRGRGGHIINIDLSLDPCDTVTHSPPYYDDVESSPPPMPSVQGKHGRGEVGSEAPSSSKRRRLGSPVEGTDMGYLDRLAEIISKQMVGIEERMEDRMARMEGRIMDRMNKMEGQMDRLDGRMDKMEGQMDKMEGRMDKMEGRMDKMEGQMDRLDGRMDRMEGRMDRLEDQITKLDQRLGDLGEARDKQEQELEDQIIKLDQRLGDLGEAREKQEQELEADIDSVRAEVQDFDERMCREVQSEVEDQLTLTKWDLKDYVEEQIADATDTIRGQLSEGEISVEGIVRLV